MKLLVLCLFVALANAEWFEDSYQRFMDYQGNFKTKFHSQFAGWSLEKVTGLMGFIKTPKPEHSNVRIQKYSPAEIGSIPDSFFSEKNWPKCASTIGYIKDQAACGSCWAVAASTVIGDRICIAHGGPDPNVTYNSNGKNLNEVAPPISYSAEHIMSCCKWCAGMGGGCNGGWPIDAMIYAANKGIVTGGWFNSDCGCYPYGVDPTNFSEEPTPQCQDTSCSNSQFTGTFDGDRHHAADHYQINANVADIQTDIMKYGPVECGFDVYENFMHYSGGIYDHKEGPMLGGHAVTITGWGALNNVPYWKIHNSWNVTWGLKGIFLFKRGINLCNMEAHCVGARFSGVDSTWGLKCY